jgi:hypothetical protein
LRLKNFDAKTLEIKVFDAVGKLIYSKKMGQLSGDLTEQINLKNQAAGVYFLQVQTERRNYPLRLTKL